MRQPPPAIGDATQSHRRRRGREHQSVICRLIFVQSALALDAQRRTVVPAHAARALHCGRGGAGFGSTLRLRVIEKYQGLIRPFQRLGETYELRSG